MFLSLHFGMGKVAGCCSLKKVPDQGGMPVVQESSDQHCHQLQLVQTAFKEKQSQTQREMKYMWHNILGNTRHGTTSILGKENRML